jgi:hypothetical protein
VARARFGVYSVVCHAIRYGSGLALGFAPKMNVVRWHSFMVMRGYVYCGVRALSSHVDCIPEEIPVCSRSQTSYIHTYDLILLLPSLLLWIRNRRWVDCRAPNLLTS